MNLKTALAPLFLIVIIPLVFAFSGCSTPIESMTQIDYPPSLQQAQKDIQNSDFVSAEGHIRKYLNNPQDVYWHGHAYLLLGETREAAGRNDEALEAYKQAITQGTGFDHKITVQALYRISWVYENTQQYQNLLVVLQDLERNVTDADYFTKYIETPSRMANTYFVLGKWNKALEQRNRVTSQVITATQLKSPSMPKIYAALLYRSFVNLQPKKGSLDPHLLLPLTQKELLDVAEMAEMVISNKALAQLRELYDLQWKTLSPVKTFKKVEQRLEYNKQKLDELAQFMDQMEELKSSRRPSELIANAQTVGGFFRHLGEIEKQVRLSVKRLDLGVQKSPQKGT
jgi:tetratricopeptide (TPR) repeat protein